MRSPIVAAPWISLCLCARRFVADAPILQQIDEGVFAHLPTRGAGNANLRYPDGVSDTGHVRSAGIGRARSDDTRAVAVTAAGSSIHASYQRRRALLSLGVEAQQCHQIRGHRHVSRLFEFEEAIA